jgi:hypothetical protein
MLSTILHRFGRRTPDRRFNIDPATLGLQFSPGQDPRSRAIRMLLRAGGAFLNYPLTGGVPGSSSGRVLTGDSGSTDEMLNDLLRSQLAWRIAAGYHDPEQGESKDFHTDTVEPPMSQRADAIANRLAQWVNRLRQVPEGHPYLQSLLPGTAAYRSVSTKLLDNSLGPNLNLAGRDTALIGLLNRVRQQNGVGNANALSRQLTGGLVHHDLNDLVGGSERLAMLGQDPGNTVDDLIRSSLGQQLHTRRQDFLGTL